MINRRMNSILSNRYYNDPPYGGYIINEEHEYILPVNESNRNILFISILNNNNHVECIKLKAQPLYKKIKENDTLLGSECSICLDNYKNNEYFRNLPCNHSFHKKCIDRWVKKNNNCPICRKNIC